MTISYEQQLDFAKVFGESVLYGADCVLMITVVHIQLTSCNLLPSHKVLLFISELMFLVVSVHLALLLYECMSGSVPLHILRTAVAVAQFELALGYSILVWRAWVIWNRSIHIIFVPALAVLGSLSLGLANAFRVDSYDSLSTRISVASIILAVVNTTLCTTLIAGRLMYLDRVINGHLAFGSGKDGTYTGVILMMVESGAILALANIVALVLEILQHPGLHVMLNMMVPITNIVPTTVIVLSHFNLSPGDTMCHTATVRFGTRFDLSAFGTGDGGRELFRTEASASSDPPATNSVDTEKQSSSGRTRRPCPGRLQDNDV